MSQVRRLTDGGRINREEPLTFSFDGKEYVGYRGDTLASALLANDVHLVGRSFKYHRPRGIVTAGIEEPSALADVNVTPESEQRRDPNCRMPVVELRQGLSAESINAFPSLSWDWGAINSWGERFFAAGFYYKIMTWPKWAWYRVYEPFIRMMAGLGKAPKHPDPDRYERVYKHCDVLVIGGGPAGLAAAKAASVGGARVILCDDQPELGGSLLNSPATIDGMSSDAWIAQTLDFLLAEPEVTVLSRATVSTWYDHNYLGVLERLTDHLDAYPNEATRQRYHKIRAKQVVIAAGMLERPAVFRNNDLPGIMLASAVETYIRRYAVAPGTTAVVVTNNDLAYGAVHALLDAGITVQAVVDTRQYPDGDLTRKAMSRGVSIIENSCVLTAIGRQRVQSVTIATLDHSAEGYLEGTEQTYSCDLVAMSQGHNPNVSMYCQSGMKPMWDEGIVSFVPGEPSPVNPSCSVGACNGALDLARTLEEGHQAGLQAAATVGFQADPGLAAKTDVCDRGSIRPIWIHPSDKPADKGGKLFVDWQNDVTAADLQLAVRENFRSVEHIKRYTTNGMATDQGKLSNVNALGIVSVSTDLGLEIPEIGTTTFRPPYAPLTFGALAGREPGDFLDIERRTAIDSWHVKNRAVYEDVGQWKRPWYFPKPGETMSQAVRRECLAVRQSVGILDASTLGKIVVNGPDAAEFLNRVYTNKWSKLGIGKCRYGLMLNEAGMVMDDGVTSRISETEYHMTTTTGGAANVMSHLEDYLQTEWTDLQVYLTSVTEQWAVASLAGPNSRRVLEQLTDIDLSAEAFPFMTWQEATVADITARIFRISFTGDLSYEINVPADYGLAMWNALMLAGEKYDITPYGTETMHVLRAEKGFIIVGQETDGSVTADDLDHNWIVKMDKPDFIGKRSITRADMGDPMRKQLVGVLTKNRQQLVPEGSQLVRQLKNKPPMEMVGHITSSYDSPNCGGTIALALVKGGRDRLGETLYAPQADGSVIECETCKPIFYDAEGARKDG